MKSKDEIRRTVERVLALARELRDEVEEIAEECEQLEDVLCDGDEAVSAACSLEGALDELDRYLQM